MESTASAPTKLKDNIGHLVIWKGTFGFIRFDNRNVFVHEKCYTRGLPELDQKVQFDFGLSHDPNKPPQAVNVRVLKTARAMRAEEEVRRGLQALASGGAA
jgi:hypothetical protein